MSNYDAVVIGAGPNGLAAAVELARNGAGVLVLEAAAEVGGGTRTAELTLPGFRHDVCSAVHPLGVLSPFFRTLPLEQYGLRWLYPKASVAHPLEQQPAAILSRNLKDTLDTLDVDAAAWERMVRPFLGEPERLLKDVLAPLGIPGNPLLFLRFGLKAIWPAVSLARFLFKGTPAKALFAGLSAHSVLPLEKTFTSAIGLLFAVSGHVVDWPVAEGGSASISRALAAYLIDLNGDIQTDTAIDHLTELPPARVYLFDTDPRQLAQIAGTLLPQSYVRSLRQFHYGPGVFKMDWALAGPIPWKDPRCLEASTVHVGGTLEEIAASEWDAWQGRHSRTPFLILCQQSQVDGSRAPEGKHTGYAYCHVPHGSTYDMTEAIESQIERFAPGFKDLILERHTMNTGAFARYNRNFFGGAITGGSNDLSQLFTRPVARLDPYSTPHKRIFICSASTPPGGGVHGMCGYHAAQSALKRLDHFEIGSLV